MSSPTDEEVGGYIGAALVVLGAAAYGVWWVVTTYPWVGWTLALVGAYGAHWVVSRFAGWVTRART